MSGSAAERLVSTRSKVEQVCRWLTSPSPEMLDLCSDQLEMAIHEMTGTVSALRQTGGDAEDLAEAWHLQRAVRKAGKLLDNAADYQHRWARRMAAMTGGYRPGGQPPAAAHPGRIWLQA